MSTYSPNSLDGKEKEKNHKNFQLIRPRKKIKHSATNLQAPKTCHTMLILNLPKSSQSNIYQTNKKNVKQTKTVSETTPAFKARPQK